MDKLMNIDYLVAYYFVITLGSFTQAAKKLHISQPGISFQIQNLEKELGLPLIEYKNKKIYMTEPGKRLFSFAEKVYFERVNLLHDLEQLRKSLSGNLSIIASRIAAEYILPEFISDFNRHYPAIDTNINVSDSKNVIKELKEGKYIVGFCSVLPDGQKLEYFKIAKEDVVVVVSNNHHLARFQEVSLADLARETIILRVDAREQQRDPVNLLLDAGFDVNQAKSKLVLGTNTGIITAVESGTGVAFMSSLAIRQGEGFSKIKTLKIKDTNLGRIFYCVFNRECTSSPILNEFINFVKIKTQ
jgi:DNA-binding transcriptional LysR family regulator